MEIEPVALGHQNRIMSLLQTCRAMMLDIWLGMFHAQNNCVLLFVVDGDF